MFGKSGVYPRRFHRQLRLHAIPDGLVVTAADSATNPRSLSQHLLAQLGAWYPRFASFIHMYILGPTAAAAAFLVALLALGLATHPADADAQSKRALTGASAAQGGGDATLPDLPADSPPKPPAGTAAEGTRGGAAKDTGEAIPGTAEDAGAPDDDAGAEAATGAESAAGTPAGDNQTAPLPASATAVEEAFPGTTSSTATSNTGGCASS